MANAGLWWGAVRAVRTFPRGSRRACWHAAWVLAGDSPADRTSRHPGAPQRQGGNGSRRVVGEPIGGRRCLVCSTDDVAHDGWIGVGAGVVCPDCGRAALRGSLPYGRCVAAYRGRVGSPRRSLGEAYRAVVAFKERRPGWAALAVPLARSLAWSIEELCGDHGAEQASPIGRRLVVPVPSFESRRPHVEMLTALAALRLPRVAVRLRALAKTRDFGQKGLSRAERLAESAHAYVVRPVWTTAIAGRHVIVTDDLMTTGATLEACARVLLAAGAAAVDGAAVVRVIRAPPERVVSVGARQLRLQLRELDARGRAPVAPECGSLWVVFACSARCPVTAVAGPYALPTFDAVSYHRWMCRCGSSHLIRVRREWLGAFRESIVVGVGERRPPEILIGVVQGAPKYV
jgi:predicted amidophosphoribosyltransferase